MFLKFLSFFETWPVAIAETISEVFRPFAFVVPGKLKKWPRGSEFFVLEGGDINVDLFSNPLYLRPMALALGVEILDNMWHFAPDLLLADTLMDILLCLLVLMDIVYFELLATGPTYCSHGIFM
jgi:hypothetical protein